MNQATKRKWMIFVAILVIFFAGLGAGLALRVYLFKFGIGVLEKEKIVEVCPTDPRDEILPPPVLDKSLPKPLVTNFSGEVRINWSEVPHASQYLIKLYNDKNRLVRNWKTTKTSMYLKDVPFREDQEFTTYQLRLATLNRANKAGADSENYQLDSRRLKTLVAPSVKGITVED